MKELKISDYLKKYYHLDEKYEYETEYLDPVRLLRPERIDLGAKLYYIHSKVTGQNERLARCLYAKHIMAFQDGIVQEAGNPEKKGMEKYFQDLDNLILIFSKKQYDPEKSWIPVDYKGNLLDGAHRVACAIYFKQKIKIVKLHTVKAYLFDYRFFLVRGLEREYLKLMAATFAEFHKGVTIVKDPGVISGIPLYYEKRGKKKVYLFCGQHQTKSKLEEINNVLDIAEIEKRGKIESSLKEQIFVKSIRFIRNIYTRTLIVVKRILGMPT